VLFGHPDCTPILLDIIHDDNDDKMIRQQAVSSLAYIKSSDIPKVMVEIYDQIDELKDQVLDALEDVNYPNAIQSLHALLGHEDWMIRKSVISSVAKIGNEESINQLKAMHEDENPEVRTELSKGLGILGIDEAIPVLMILSRDSSSNVRQEALSSLDLAFPNFAHKEFLKLAVETDYPERVKVVELLGNYRSPDVRDILILLCADVNNAVKTQAVNSLKRIDQNLSAQLRYVRTGEKRSFKPLAVILDKQKTMYSELAWLARGQGIAENQQFSWIIQQAQTDADLKREYRPFFILVNFLLITLCVIMPPALLAIVPRTSIYLGSIFWRNKWFYGAMIVLALVSLLPKIREGAKIKFVKNIYSFIRFVGIFTLIISLFGLGFYYWWICIPIFVLIGLGFYFWRKNKLRKKIPST
jgi:HEAT repeat protein